MAAPLLACDWVARQVRHRQTGTAVDDAVHSISSIKRVMSAWTPRHIDVMVELAKSLRRASEAGGA